MRIHRTDPPPPPAPQEPSWLLIIVVIIAIVFLSQGGIITPPEPPTPPVPVDPAPIAAEGLRILIVYDEDAESTLPPEQGAILSSPELRDWADANCAKDATGQSELRIWPSTVEVGDDQPIWREAMKLKRDGPNWLIVSNGKSGYSGPLPPNLAELLKIAEKFK